MEDLPPLETVSPDTPLKHALAKMHTKNYSQLPVVRNKRCIGSLDLNSIYVRLRKSEGEGRLLTKFMDCPAKLFVDTNPRYVSPNDDILKHIEWIAEKGFVFVGTPLNTVAVITNYDLVHFFKRETEPFLLLRDIETCLRYIVGQKLRIQESPETTTSITRIKRDLHTISLNDIGFSDLRRLILTNWAKLRDCFINKKTATRQLEAVHILREQILDFRTPLSASQLAQLKMLRDNYIQMAESARPPISMPKIPTTTVAPDQEISGSESFEHAEVQINVTAGQKQLRVGDLLHLEIELTNTGKKPAVLLKINEAIPKGFELAEKPEFCRVEDGSIPLKRKRLRPSMTEEITLVLRSKVQGMFALKPSIGYLDEEGNCRSHQTEPIDIMVKELGIKGWLKGDR
jgi:hypothetical protein